MLSHKWSDTITVALSHKPTDKPEGEEEEMIFASATIMGDQLKYEEAMCGEDSERWKEVMDVEINHLKEIEVFEEVKRPAGANVIGSL